MPFRRVSNTRNDVELLIFVTPEFCEAMDPNEVPPCGPGQLTTSPTDCELYGRGYIEVPKNCHGGNGGPRHAWREGSARLRASCRADPAAAGSASLRRGARSHADSAGQATAGALASSRPQSAQARQPARSAQPAQPAQPQNRLQLLLRQRQPAKCGLGSAQPS